MAAFGERFGGRLAAFLAIACVSFISGCQWGGTDPDIRAIRRDIVDLTTKNTVLEKRLFAIEKDFQKLKPCRCKDKRAGDAATYDLLENAVLEAVKRGDLVEFDRDPSRPPRLIGRRAP